LDQPENYMSKVHFLLSMDQKLPNHLFCFVCAAYHLRIQKGQEKLKGPGVLNPLFNCPNAFNNLMPPPRTRITPGRNLPFTFVQLAARAERFGPDYGISVDSLARRWEQGDWTHLTRYHIINGHFFMRVVSSCYAPPGLTKAGERLLLYSREDYTPYFSVCSHWQDGLLMPLCKCALSHIPVPRAGGGPEELGLKLKDRINKSAANPNAIVTLCPECRPMRRCPICPTEYLIEIRLAEDKYDHSFKRAIVVTRWSDLGDGSSPLSIEWAACNGEPVEYDSFEHIGKRALSGQFESRFTEDHIPGQRIMSLNPKKKYEGEEGDEWY